MTEPATAEGRSRIVRRPSRALAQMSVTCLGPIGLESQPMRPLALLALFFAFQGIAVAAPLAADGLPVFGGCTSAVRVRPSSILIACGDGNFFATKLHWSRWDATDALAVGIGHSNDCTPDCARGHFHTFPVVLRLSVPVVCVGLNEYSKISWRFPRGTPQWTRPGSESFSCHWRKVRPS